ncbi:PEP-CTERM sorting domain-containing protein [Accumulibacter sp.]|uniref:PEP-CTERM sorting domain-containing protein n=1 Tax=Accumulibacter sp. TaxID=2053492 RepID=UPI0025CC323C|nr:PEP-CTERM sorting domain-containing protein [Accumulibacter sp.]MCM8610804.1 PEP-CTERM sorting domain-containing protein [Accumulibacter sp.]MCM8636412.1 PEP-CTERM sorting domain-containing protein [Accumulibacter sp.]MCM8640113.1 PEP-CTERM sorting domain-containing protein [Accumulibacter sp.]
MIKSAQLGFVGVFVALSGTASGAAISLVNQGFESDLSGWSVKGLVTPSPSVTVTTYDGNTHAVVPWRTRMARLVSQAESGGPDPFRNNVGELNTFFGFDITARLAPGTDPWNGSGISQSFSGRKDDVLTQYWSFYSEESSASQSLDTAFYVVTDASGVVVDFDELAVAKISGGYTPWQSLRYVLPADGTYTIGFGVVNWQDEYYNSELFLDDGLPEPGSFALLGLALAGLSWVRRGPTAKG